MEPRLVRMDHSDPQRANVLFVDWLITNACNYACSYCPSSLHDGTLPAQEPGTVIRFCERLIDLCTPRKQQVCFQFTGGEVTLMPELLMVLDAISALGAQVGLISNGSRQLSWWRQARDKLNFVVLTYHPERASAIHICAVARFLSERIRTHVNVATPPNFFDHCVGVASMLEQSCQNMSITLKPMFIEFGTDLYRYAPEQMRIFREREFKPALTRPLMSTRGEMLATFEDSSTMQLPATAFITRQINNWRGWSCNVGIELLSIKPSGEVYRSLCQAGGQIGHVSSPESFALPDNPVLCPHTICTCQTDIMVSRQRTSRS